LDPRTGRIGLGNGELHFDGDEDANRNLFLLPIGTVQGTVRRPNGTAVNQVRVELSSSRLVRPAGLVRDVSFFGPGKLTTTTNLDGAYSIDGVPEGSFALHAVEVPTGASGDRTGSISSEGETLTVDVTLEGRGRVAGRVLLSDGETPVAFARVVFDH